MRIRTINEDYDPYEDYGGRKNYLKSLADDYGVPYNVVRELAMILGREEDFDALVSEVEDYAEMHFDDDEEDFEESFENETPVLDRNKKKELQHVYSNIEYTLFSGPNADVVDNIRTVFSDMGGDVTTYVKNPNYIRYDGNVNGYMISGSISRNSLTGDLRRLAEDLTMAYYRTAMNGKDFNTLSLIKAINESCVKESYLAGIKITQKQRRELNKIRTDLEKETLQYLVKRFGFEDEKEAKDMCYVHTEVTPVEDGRIKFEVRAELGYKTMDKLGSALQSFLDKFDKDAYFEQEDAGIMNAYVDMPDKKECFMTEDFSSDEMRIYMNTWANYNENGADLSQYGIESIRDGWLTVDEAIEFAEEHADEEPFINDTDNVPIPVSEYDNPIETLNFLKEIEDGDYDIDLMSAIMEAANVDFKGAMEIYDDGNYVWYPGITDFEELAAVIIDEYGSPRDALGDHVNEYVDEDEMRRDYEQNVEEVLRDYAREDIARDEGIEEDEVTEDQIEEYIEKNKDFLLDECVRLNLEGAERGEIDLSTYFDYEAYGRDLSFRGYYKTPKGIIRIYN